MFLFYSRVCGLEVPELPYEAQCGSEFEKRFR